MVDEELAGRRVRDRGPRHGDGAAVFVRPLPDSLRIGARCPSLLPQLLVEAAALDHEAGDHPVEDQAVEELASTYLRKFSVVIGAFCGPARR